MDFILFDPHNLMQALMRDKTFLALYRVFINSIQFNLNSLFKAINFYIYFCLQVPTLGNASLISVQPLRTSGSTSTP